MGLQWNSFQLTSYVRYFQAYLTSLFSMFNIGSNITVIIVKYIMFIIMLFETFPFLSSLSILSLSLLLSLSLSLLQFSFFHRSFGRHERPKHPIKSWAFICSPESWQNHLWKSRLQQIIATLTWIIFVYVLLLKNMYIFVF